MKGKRKTKLLMIPIDQPPAKSNISLARLLYKHKNSDLESNCIFERISIKIINIVLNDGQSPLSSHIEEKSLLSKKLIISYFG
jgi:hypothetical protein